MRTDGLRFYSKYSGKPLEILNSYVILKEDSGSCVEEMINYWGQFCDLGDTEESIAEVWDI